MRKRVYVSFPYRNDPFRNLKLIDKLIEKLYEIYPNFLFISPLHLFGYLTDLDIDEMDYDNDIMVFDLMVTDICDKVWIFDYTGKSIGCSFEKLEGYKANKEVRVWNRHEIEQLVGGIE